MAALLSDVGQISAFVTALFRYADPDTFVSLRAFDQYRRDVPPVFVRSVAAAPLDALIREAAIAATEAASQNTPAVFAPPICTLNNRHQARGVDLANGLVLSVELDDVDPDAARTRLEGVIGRATVVVYSGSDWSNQSTGEVKPKIHIHWRLSEPTQEDGDHAKLRRARELASMLVGADPTAKPIVHPLRWPGSWNCKATPRMSTIASYDDGAEINLGEALDALEGAIEAEGWAQAEMPRAAAQSTAPLDDVRSAMASIPNLGVEIHYDTWIRLGYAMWRATGGSPEGFDVWDQWSKISDKYDGAETERTWRRICAAMSGATPSVTVGAGTIFYLAARNGWVRLHPFFEKARNAFGLGDEPDKAGQNRTERDKRPAILSLAQLDELPPPEWIIDGLIPDQGFVVPYGPPKSGKTFLMLSAGLHVADGRDWFGKKVRQGAVIYIAGEGTGGLSLRLRAMRQHYGISADVPFWVIPRAVNFRNDTDVTALAKLIRDTVGEIPVRMVFLDTLARAMPGADENSAQEVGLVVAASDWLRDELSCTVLPIHHSGKDAERGARGTSALRGAWDAAFEVKSSDKGKTITMTVADQKEAEAGEEMVFDMVEVVVGIGRKSLVPVLREADPDNPDKPDTSGGGSNENVRPMSGMAGTAVRCLRDLIGGPEGAILPPLSDLPSFDTRGVRLEQWRNAFYKLLPERNQDTRQRAFVRAKDILLQQGAIGIRDPFVWLIRSPL